MEKKNKVLEYPFHERHACYYISNFLSMPLKWVFYFSFKEGKTNPQREKIICFRSPGQITTDPRCGPKITLALVWSIFLPHVA